MAHAPDLASAWERLQDAWHTAMEMWQDEVSQRIERDYYSELESLVPTGVDSMRQLEAVLRVAERAVH